MVNHLGRAHDELVSAEETASGRIREQLQSIDEGVFEETDGERTQSAPGPKDDRLLELEKKLRGLEDEAEEPTADRIRRAREHLDDYRERWAEDET